MRFFAGLAALVLFQNVGCGDDSAASGGQGAGGGQSSGAGGIGGGDGGSAGGGGAFVPEGPTLLGGDCDPLVPAFCGLPFPSDVYLEDDPSGRNPSGRSVRFGATTLPTRKSTGEHFDPAILFDHDGWSPGGNLLTHLPAASADGCADPTTIEQSITPSSKTVLLEASTGLVVPHWVDLDMSTDHDGQNGTEDERLFMIRPAVRLKDGTRYIVAIRDVIDTSGAVIAPSPAFKALRDGSPAPEGGQLGFTVEARRPLYEDIFSTLEGAGVDRSDLQIAWDFTTSSKEATTSPMVSVRDQALALVGAEGPTYEVISVEEFPTESDHPYLLRRIEVEMEVPLYLSSDAVQFNSSDEDFPLLSRDASGAITQNGTMKHRVLIHVPRSVLTAEPHGLLQNGHGLFGSRFEGENSFVAKAAFDQHYIAFATNYFGFDSDAEIIASVALSGRFRALESFTERQVQGMVNQLLAMRMMRGRIATDGLVGDGEVLIDPSWIDADLRAYRGDSQGGIMGATYMAVSTDVTRGLLGEPGMPYSVLLNRSVDWTTYEAILKTGYGDSGVNVQLLLGLIQLMWDRSEPSGFAPYITENLLPNTPSHRVILAVARGDHQVTPWGAHILARAMNAGHLRSNDPAQPNFGDVFGVPNISAPVTEGSVLVEYDFGLPAAPLSNLPNEAGCDPHDRVRMLTPSFLQQDHFFRSGTIEWFCDGACNCSDDADDPNEEDLCDASYVDQCN